MFFLYLHKKHDFENIENFKPEHTNIRMENLAYISARYIRVPKPTCSINFLFQLFLKMTSYMCFNHSLSSNSGTVGLKVYF